MIGILLAFLLGAVNGGFGLWNDSLFNMWVCGWCFGIGFTMILDRIREKGLI